MPKPTAIALDPVKYTDEEIQSCITLLQDLVQNSIHLAYLSQEQRIALITAAGRLSRPDRIERRKRKKESKYVKKLRVINYERSARANTGIRTAREATVFTAPLQIAE